MPAEIKPRMVPLYDEFVKGYCLSRAMDGKEDALENGEVFARCIQKAMIVSCGLMFCLQMKDEPKFKFIMDGILISTEDNESDLEDLDRDEERMLEEELRREEEAAAEEERLRRRAEGLPEEEEVVEGEDSQKSDGGRPGSSDRPSTSKNSDRPKSGTVQEEEIEKIDMKELIEESRDYFRNSQTQRVIASRNYGKNFVFKSPPL